MLLINLVITTICLYLITKINQRFLIPSLVNHDRFKLFALRDELTLLAMKGEVSQEDKEYKIILNLLNASIINLDSFSIVNYLKLLYEITFDGGRRKEIEKLLRSLERHNNPNLAGVACSYFEVTRKILLRHTRIMRGVIVPIIMVIIKPIKFIVNLFRVTTKFIDFVQDKFNIFNVIERDLESNARRLRLASS